MTRIRIEIDADITEWPTGPTAGRDASLLVERIRETVTGLSNRDREDFGLTRVGATKLCVVKTDRDVISDAITILSAEHEKLVGRGRRTVEEGFYVAPFSPEFCFTSAETLKHTVRDLRTARDLLEKT